MVRCFLALFVCGCGAGALPDVVEPERPCASIAVSPSSLTWRGVHIGEPEPQVVEVTNGCDVPVHLHTAVEGPPLFSLSLNEPLLQPGELRALTVEFTAVDGKLHEATLGFYPWGGRGVEVDLDGRAKTDWDQDGHADTRAGGGDCDDTNAAVNPDAAEVCNGVDDDCSGEADDLVVWWFFDHDRDGWGGGSVTGGCEPGDGQVGTGGDCDDADPATYPGAADPVCDGLDRDCDGRTDDVAAMIGAAEYESIQDALDSAVDGDAVEVCPGTHVESLSTSGVDISLSSRSGDPHGTVLDGRRQQRILTLDGGTVAVRHLSFERGASADEGGALFADVDALTLEGCTFTDSEAVQGGAVYVELAEESSGELLVRECTFDDNVAAERGGGLAVVVDIQGASVEISGSTFTANNASTHGGGLFYRGVGRGALTIDTSTFDGNSAHAGGGARLVGQGDTLALVDTSFTTNHAHSGGGLDARGELTTQWCTFSANTSITGGGGAYLVGDSWLEEVTLDGNITVHEGSAVYASGSTTLEDCTITSNSSTAIDPGGAVYLPPESDLESIDTDWGQGSTDNSPADLCTATDCDETLGTSESFVCTDGAC